MLYISIVVLLVGIVYICVAWYIWKKGMFASNTIDMREAMQRSNVQVHKVTHKTQFGEADLFNPTIAPHPTNPELFLVFGRLTRSFNSKYMSFCNANKSKIPISHTYVDGAESYFNNVDKNETLLSALVQYTTNKTFDRTSTPAVINPFITKAHIENISNPGIEDPRLFRFKNNMWCITGFRGRLTIDPSSNLQHNMIMFTVRDPGNITVLKYANRTFPLDKNWQPFEHDESLYLVYSMSPHIILKVDTDTGVCTEQYSTPFPDNSPVKGTMGGGAPPQLVTWKKKQYYLGVAHTRYDFMLTHTRKTIWYLFQSSPPFAITHIGPAFGILQPDVDIEYVTGLVVDQDRDIAYISFGINDCFGGFKQLSLSNILATLVKV